MSRYFALLAVSLLFAAGCGGDPFERVAVRGTVTLDGKPMPKGSITFVPLAAGMPAAQGAVQDGKFEIAVEEGPSAGKHKVRVDAPINAPYDITDPEAHARHVSAGGSPYVGQKVAAQFNTDTTLTATVAKEGPNTFEFPVQKPLAAGSESVPTQSRQIAMNAAKPQNESGSERPPDSCSREPRSTAPLRVYGTDELFAGDAQIEIIHHGDHYRLRITRNGKLILTK